MSTSTMVILAAILLVVTVSSVSAIICYECNSGTDPACAGASQTGRHFADCTVLPQQPQCYRITTVGPNPIVTRGCGKSSLPENKDGCTNKTLNNQETCYCSRDYCNTAASGPGAGFLISMMCLAGLVNLLR